MMVSPIKICWNALDRISVEESLSYMARSVALAANAADTLRFVETIFDTMCTFVAEAGTVDFFMVGDVRGSWKSAPALIFTLIFLDVRSPQVSGMHACLN